jgi:hypothetical protein
MTLFRSSVVGVVVAMALSGCAEPPPPEPVPQPEPVPEPEPPPPPPPKCEALAEKCKADATTVVPIPGTNYVFTPPSGWIYAKLAEATVAQNDEAGAVLVLSSFEPPKPAPELAKKRDEVLGSLAELVGLEPKKGALGAPNQTTEMAGLKMSFWEKPGAKRSGSEGAMLVISAPADDSHIFGLGYAPRDDNEGTAAILQALESLKKGGNGDASQ